MRDKAPDVLDFLITIAAPGEKKKKNAIPPICTAYGILMNCRWQELSLIQKMNTVILGSSNASAKVFST